MVGVALLGAASLQGSSLEDVCAYASRSTHALRPQWLPELLLLCPEGLPPSLLQQRELMAQALGIPRLVGRARPCFKYTASSGLLELMSRCGTAWKVWNCREQKKRVADMV